MEEHPERGSEPRCPRDGDGDGAATHPQRFQPGTLEQSHLRGRAEQVPLLRWLQAPSRQARGSLVPPLALTRALAAIAPAQPLQIPAAARDGPG